LTRAEKGMILMAPSIESAGSKRSVAGLLYQSIQQNEALKFHGTTQRFNSQLVCGHPHHQRKKLMMDAISLTAYHASSWREKLVIKQSGSGYFKDLHDEQRNKINYGIHMHAVLSRIRYIDEIESTLDQILIEGLITHKRPRAAVKRIESIVVAHAGGLLVSGEWKVQTEVPVISPGGNENRIDRLLISGKRAIIIDFKTGERKKTDQQQVLEYIDILRQMNFTTNRGIFNLFA